MLYKTAEDVQKALLLDTPKRCPRCDSKVKKYNVDGEEVVMCKNNKCPWPLCLVENAGNSKVDQDSKSDEDDCDRESAAKLLIESEDSLVGGDTGDYDNDKKNAEEAGIVPNEIPTASDSLDFSMPCKTIFSSGNLTIGYNGEHVIISYLKPTTEHGDGNPPSWIQFPEFKVAPGDVDHVVTLIQEFSQELTIKFLRQKDLVVQYTTEAAIAKQFLSKVMINDLRNLLSTKTLRTLLSKRKIVKHKRMEKPIKVKKQKPNIFIEPEIKERKPKQKPIILIEPKIKERKPKRPKIPVNLIIQQILEKDLQAMEKISKKIQRKSPKEEKVKYENIPLQLLKVDACNTDDYAASNSVNQFKRSLVKKLLRKASSCKKQPRYQKSFKGPPGPTIETPGTVPLDFVDINNLESECLESKSKRNANICGDQMQTIEPLKRRRGRPPKNQAILHKQSSISPKEEFDANAFKNRTATGIKRKRGRPRKVLVQNITRDSQLNIWNDTNEDTKHNAAHMKRGRGRPRKSEASRANQYFNKLLHDTDNVPLTNIRQMMFCKNMSEEDMAFRLKGNLAAQASRSYSRGKSKVKLENLTTEADY